MSKRLKLHRFPSNVFTSNTYVVESLLTSSALVIDIGEYEKTKRLLRSLSKIHGVFLTHCHYDHIYYINEITREFPDTIIYGSSYTLDALSSSKMNLSYYRELPVSYNSSNTVAISNNQCLDYSGDLNIRAIATPGHTIGSMSYIIGPFLFTGDAYIPGKRVVTKLRGGNKKQSAKSLNLINNELSDDTFLCPGHGETILINSIEQVK
jgi:glyoxylase-like metal-dependent hydrolase (beta-lactamase superfamily II)